MNNYTESGLLDMIYDENQNLKSIIFEIKNFNENFSFIETFITSTSMKVNDIILIQEWDEDYFEEERDYLAERILRLDDALSEMWLATYEYRGEEFYQDWEINAFGCKIWIKISDSQLFKEFISTQKSSNIDRLYEFMYSCILDSQNRVNFQKQKDNQIENNQDNLDIVWKLQEIWDISHSGLRELIEDYNNLRLQQSLLSKFYITKFRDFFKPKSIEFIGDFQQFEKVWEDWFWAFESLLKSTSQDWKHVKYILQLGTFLEESLNHTSKLILQEGRQSIKRIPNLENSKETIKFKNLEHLHFIHKFYYLYDKRKYFLKANMDI